MIQKKITVYGMTCEACRTTVIRGLELVNGIKWVSVNLPESIVIVQYDEDIIDIDGIKKEITALGYDAM
ncbi:MAG: heavy-metal-associated domain-containing protein [Candidatus Cloacimonadales bacterium]|jgi:Cu+-exporting ATPase|nr:heavy-metal-associated domain-containing protein [Candidatus Cloacimonadota bacterium]MDD2651239.1 heavy-metal-associated domain-containing protein [Candidatus Cloacimonadota bacterium]MDD3500959.1 heavy-metal-associated domain-containing protein [Candidatus Cloacimonadota bacterium]MDX9977488.1 heavy-metal-associated domain-containing protein [Candidatus Cloacimonadales bacterium]